jgi:hypothetical protein
MLSRNSYETPELAAAAPGSRLRPVAVDVDPAHRRATVLLLASSGESIVRYCVRNAAGWQVSDRDPSCSAGLAWTDEFASGDPESVLTFAERVPEGTHHAVVRFGESERSVETPNGYLIASWWGAGAPEEADDAPRVVAYHG